MKLMLISLNTVIFLFLSGLHFYWLTKNPVNDFAVIPETNEGSLVFKPGTVVTFVVALGLLMFAVITLGNSDFLENWMNQNIIHYGTLGIAVVFLLRAIGDFKYVGIFKTVLKTEFANNDTHYFVPLCLWLSVVSFYLYFSK